MTFTVNICLLPIFKRLRLALLGDTIAGIEVGCDEAGRGCLAGPVVAAAVILPKTFYHPLLDDSKKLTARQRVLLRVVILQSALNWGIGVCSPEEIDQINILQASFKAMHKALDQLTMIPDHILVDGNRFRPYRQVSHACMIKGDARFQSIAAASVLAKTHRDDLMASLHEKFPQYGWNHNKGYPTVSHRKAIANHGTCPFHRKSFKLTDPQLPLF